MTQRFDTIRISGVFITKAPLSHIGESVSTTSYLVQDPILQHDGTVRDVFCYSGNAWRGQLRDMMARHTALEAQAPLPVDTFHLLFSGGRLDHQERCVDVQGARDLRSAVPMLALLGGGIGTQLLSGRLRVSNVYPVCQEAIPVLPRHLHGEADKISYAALTFEKSFSRKDDGKDMGGRDWLETEDPGEKGRGRPDQMRMTSELVVPGVQLWSEIHAAHISVCEIGCLVQALFDFSRSPCIGGQASRGHGLVDLEYSIELPGEEIRDFVLINSDGIVMSEFASSARDEYLRSMSSNREALRTALRCAA